MQLVPLKILDQIAVHDSDPVVSLIELVGILLRLAEFLIGADKERIAGIQEHVDILLVVCGHKRSSVIDAIHTYIKKCIEQ